MIPKYTSKQLVKIECASGVVISQCMHVGSLHLVCLKIFVSGSIYLQSLDLWWLAIALFLICIIEVGGTVS